MTVQSKPVYALQYSSKYRREKERKNGSAPVITFSVNLSNNGFLSPTIIRNDGRTWKQHRNVYIECGPTSDVSATAYIQMGGTKVLALVTGFLPMPKFHQHEAVNYLNFQVKLCRYFFNYKPDDMKGVNEEKSIVENLSRALEPAILQDVLGNVQVNVEVIVIDNDGNPTSACILASSLALFYGKIPMKDLVSSATLAVLPTGIILVDPTRNEKKLALPKEKNPKRMNKEHIEQSLRTNAIKGKGADIPRDKYVKRVVEQMLKQRDSNKTPSHPYGIFNLSFMPKCNEVSAPCIYGNIPKNTLIELAPILKEECVKIYEKMRNLLEEIEQNKDIKRCHKIPEIYEDIKSFYEDI